MALAALLAAGASASEDGLTPTGRAVVRYQAAQREGALAQELTLSTARLGLAWREKGLGQAKVEADFAHGAALEDAWIRADLGEHVQLRMGRFRVPFGILDGTSSWNAELGGRGPVGQIVLDQNGYAGRRAGVEGKLLAGPLRFSAAGLVPRGTGGGLPPGAPEMSGRAELRLGQARLNLGAYLRRHLQKERFFAAAALGAQWNLLRASWAAEIYAGQAPGTERLFWAGYLAASRRFPLGRHALEPELRLSFFDPDAHFEGGHAGSHAGAGLSLWLGERLRLRAVGEARLGACGACGARASVEGGARF